MFKPRPCTATVARFGDSLLLLDSAYRAITEEVSEIRALLVDPAHQLKHLNDAITELQIALDKLAEERDGLVAYMDGHKALISPIRRLPLDIIEEIFIACMPTHRNCVMSALEAPIVLGRICSSWRTIAYSTPRLWARNQPPPSTQTQKQCSASQPPKSGLVDLVNVLYRSRYKMVPIIAQQMPLHPTSSFLQALVMFASRWEHIEFTLSCVAFNAISHLTKTDVPLLKSVKFLNQDQVPPERADLEGFTMLQGPRFSSFCALDTGVITEGLPLPWNQLTVLEMTGPVMGKPDKQRKLAAVPRTVPSAAHLQAIYKSPGAYSAAVFGRPHRIRLPSHVGVGLRGFGNECNPSFRSTLATWIAKLCPCWSDHFSTRSIPRPILRSVVANLSVLKSAAIHFLGPLCWKVFVGLPGTMRELIIHDFPNRSSYNYSTITLDDDVLALLGGDSTPCPALETLHLNHCPNVSDEALLQFIMAHMSGESQSKLKYIKVQFDRHMTLDIFSSLPPFVSSNLGLLITHLPSLKKRFSPWQGVDDDPIEHLPAVPAYIL
ncbi:hypothetical protein C8F04DRAFT_1186305 [Mycena alexandri]|uniref:F-box domain-containing protein n=1 Tax=Mycena alexandri TaxID=1745969 RepID=A0AAD6WXH1_9AGAR|nr:hypothetical protein C8F04DRAFT_1186305 [Mycena alexandri]